MPVNPQLRRCLHDHQQAAGTAGVAEVEGNFPAGAVVALAEAGGTEFARGLVNYEADELRKIRGAKTKEIERTLGYKGFDEVIHRDNLVVL